MVDAKGRADLLNQKQASIFLRKNRTTIFNWVRSGRLSKKDAWSREELLLAAQNDRSLKEKPVASASTSTGADDASRPSSAVEEPPPSSTSSAPEPSAARPEPTKTHETPPAAPEGPRVKLVEHPEDLELPMPEPKKKDDTTNVDAASASKVEPKVDATKKKEEAAAKSETAAPLTYFDHLADEE